MNDADHRFGHVAVVGRPNVGKSTLVNALVGYKVSIVAPKPQTTRHRILGIATREDAQVAFVDTPGLHDPRGEAINRYLNRTARAALPDADLVMLVVDATRWTEADDDALAAAVDAGRPVVLVLNKIDLVADRATLLPRIADLSRRHAFAAVVPVSAKDDDNLDRLWQAVRALLPVAEPAYDADAVTDRSERFLVGELIREQLVLQLRDELPYSTTVQVDAWDESEGTLRIDASIFVAREGQKAIVVGAGGQQIKRIGTSARRAIETQLDRRVHLALVVRVREKWADDEAALRRLGYGD